MAKKSKTLIVVAFVLVAAFLLVYLAWPDSNLRWSKRVIESANIYSLTKSDLDKKLGPPESAGEYFQGWEYVYFLQPDGSYIDSWWLLVNIGDDGKIEAAKVATD